MTEKSGGGEGWEMEGGVAKEFGTEKNDDNGNSEDLRETSVSFVSEIQAEMRM